MHESVLVLQTILSPLDFFPVAVVLWGYPGFHLPNTWRLWCFPGPTPLVAEGVLGLVVVSYSLSLLVPVLTSKPASSEPIQV